MLRLLPLLAVCVGLAGCFVLDELEAGEKIMEQNSSRGAAKKAAAAKAGAADREAEGPPTGTAWWSEARSLTGREKAAPDDPDALVQCRLRGSKRFMRRSDCLSQGGEAD